MNIFITGKNGFIAKYLAAELQHSYNLKITSSQQNSDDIYLDLQHPQKFDYSEVSQGDFIVHLASISSPDICHNKYDYAHKINVEGPVYFINKCLERGARVLFFSSDTVYGDSGESLIFDEHSKCNPVGDYGAMKYEVEQSYINAGNAFKVFRLSYVFAKDDKFTLYLLNCSKKKETASIFHPYYRNVVYIKDVITAVVSIIEKWDKFDNSTFNVCGDQLLSKKDMTEIYRDVVDENLKTDIETPDEAFFIARPKVINLKSLYLEELIGRKPIPLKTSMGMEFNKLIRSQEVK